MTIPLVFGLAGQGCAIAFLISTISILLVALNINQFARISASPGSLYSYITDHMHPRFGVLAGWALLIAYVGTATAVSAGVTNYANVILRDRFGVEAFPWLLTALVMVFACYLAYRDVQISTRLMLWLEAASVALIALIALSIIIKHGWRPDVGQFTLQGVTPEKLRLGLVLAIFSSVGFESATSLGSEARNPLTSIPRAVKWSAILAGLFFFLCAYAEVLAFRGEAQSLDKSLAPLHVLAQKAGFPALVGTLTDLGAVLSFFSCFLACITAAARVLFLMGRHGALHSMLGETHEANQTPHRAVLLSSIAAFLPAAIMTLRGVNLFDIYGLVGNSCNVRVRHRVYSGFRGCATLPPLAGSLNKAGHRYFSFGCPHDGSRASRQPLSSSFRAVLVTAVPLSWAALDRLRVVGVLECALACAGTGNLRRSECAAK